MNIPVAKVALFTRSLDPMRYEWFHQVFWINTLHFTISFNDHQHDQIETDFPSTFFKYQNCLQYLSEVKYTILSKSPCSCSCTISFLRKRKEPLLPTLRKKASSPLEPFLGEKSQITPLQWSTKLKYFWLFIKAHWDECSHLTGKYHLHRSR